MSTSRRFMSIGLRNLFRNRRRTIITVLTIAFGVFVISMLRGFINSIQAELSKSITMMQTGDIQLYRNGYLQSSEITPLNMTMDTELVSRKLLSDGEGVFRYTPRIRFSGVLSAETSTPFFSIGCDPTKELQVCTRLKENVVRGRFLGQENPYEIMITENLEKSMKLDLGQEVIVMALTRDGVQNSMAFKIVGILASMMRSDRMLTYTNIRAVRELLELGNDEATEIVVGLEPGRNANRMKLELNSRAQAQQMDLRVTVWTDIMGFFKTVITIQDVFNLIISVILFVLVSSVVINTILMSVFERTQEIGTMRALGMRARQVVQLFLFEGSFIGLIGGLTGMSLAMLVMMLIQIKGGIVYGFATSFGASKPWILNPSLTVPFAALMCAYGMVCGLIASIYPARKAAKLTPVAALAEE